MTASGPRRLGRVVAGVVCLAMMGSACGGKERRQAHGPGGETLTGHATLRFSGAVEGVLDADLKVGCFAPKDQGDSFQVSIDSDKGVPVGGTRLLALDFVTPAYHGPRTYDLRRALATDKDFDGDPFFLLFDKFRKSPFTWGEQGSGGSIVIDPGEVGGKMSIEGWRNDQAGRVRVEGAFRCGKKAEGS